MVLYGLNPFDDRASTTGATAVFARLAGLLSIEHMAENAHDVPAPRYTACKVYLTWLGTCKMLACTVERKIQLTCSKAGTGRKERPFLCELCKSIAYF